MSRRVLVVLSVLSLVVGLLSLTLFAQEGDGSPTISIESPTDGATVPPGTFTVSGAVDRNGAGFAAEAGGPYKGEIDAAISITGSARGGTSPHSFLWTIEAAPDSGSGLFGDATTAATTFTADTIGDYTLRLTATDADGAEATDTASVSVTPRAVETLYLTAEQKSQANFADCGPLPTYATKSEAPDDGTSDKAYLGRAFGGLTCGVPFEHEMPADTQLDPSVRFRAWLGCDLPTGAPFGPAGINVDVLLTVDGAEVAGSRTSWSGDEFVCDGSNILEIDVAIPTGGITVPAEGVLAVEVLPWWVNPTGANEPVENVHLLVDSTTHPSQLQLEGGTGIEPSGGSPAGEVGFVPQPLPLDTGDARPENVYSVAEAVALVRQDSPDGPILPDDQNANGVGPGSGLIIANSQLCTAAWLFQDQDDGTYYLSTAGHCLITSGSSGPIDGSAPNAANRVDICFRNCQFNWAAGLDDFLGIRGDYVTLQEGGGYDPVAFAQAQGVGSDFGLIRIPPEANELLRPWLPQWGGPTDIYTEGLGFADTAVHFGHGNYCCPGVGAFLTRSEFDQGRVAQYNFSDETSFEAVAGWASGGDSGSAVGRADAARLETKGVIGDTAVGVLTHGLPTGHSGFFGTLLPRGLNMAGSFVNNLALVTEDAEITTPEGAEHVELYIDGELIAGNVAVGPTDSANPADAWSAEVDFAPYEGQTVQLEARWIDSDDSVLDTHSVGVSVKEPGEVSITSPTSGETVGPPFTFEGTFDTGEAGSAGDSGAAQILRGKSDEPYDILSIPEALGRYESSGHPTGPEAPRAHDGIGPGSAIRMGGFICSAAYLFEDPVTGTYYLSTAGHCLVNNNADPTPYTGQSNPDRVVSAVDICVLNCVANSPGIGVYVRVAAAGDYHPVTYARSAGIGADFGLIEIPRELNGALRPWMPQWGGPTGVETGVVGLESTAVHYGHGAYCCPGVGALATRLPHDQGRVAQFNFSDQDSFEAVLGWASGGDSGSGVGRADPAALASTEAIGDTAVGVLTHGLITGGSFFGTIIPKGLQMTEQTLPGFKPTLVLQDATIRSGASEVELGATIEQPADGAEIDPGATPMVTVSGSGAFPAEAGTVPAGSTTYWLHRSDCGADDREWMDTVQGDGPDGGSGCGSATDPAGFLTSALWDSGSTVYTFPADPRPSGDTLLDASKTVTADISYGGFVGNPTITDFEGVLFYGGGNVVARGRAMATAANSISLPMTVENPVVPAGADLTFSLIIHGSADIAFIDYGGPGGSHLTLPLAQPPARSVQVSVDDPAFGAASLLNVSGTESWSASWDAAAAGTGEHTIYARAVQGEQMSQATSVTVSVQEAVGPAVDFSWSADNRTVSFTDESTPRNAPIVGWSWDFGDGATSTEQNPVHTYSEFGTFSVALTVTDADGNSNTSQQEVTLTGPPWLVEIQLSGPDGIVFGWTEVAEPGSGESGAWASEWWPESATGGEYTLEARIFRNGEVADTDQVIFNVIGGKTIQAGVQGYDCNDSEWRFVITRIESGQSPPDMIRVTWDNGATVDVPLGNFSGRSAHYVTTENLGSTVSGARSFIYQGWNGNFNLGHGPCN